MCDRKWEDMAFAVNSSSWVLKWKINRNVFTSSRVCCLVSISLLPKSIFPFSQYQNGLFKMNRVIWTQLCACSEKPLRSACLHCLQEVSGSLKNSLQNHILSFSLTKHSQQEDNFILPILLYPNFILCSALIKYDVTSRVYLSHSALCFALSLLLSK